jgi:WD40 repeat protein
MQYERQLLGEGMRRFTVLGVLTLLLLLRHGLSSLDAQNDNTRIPITTENAPRLSVLATLESRAQNLAFSPDSTTLAAADGNNTTLWELSTFRQTNMFEGGGDFDSTIVFSADGEQLMTPAHIWDLATETDLYPYEHLLSMSDHVVARCDFILESEHVALSSTLIFDDWTTGEEIASFEDGCAYRYSYAMAFNPDRTQFAFAQWTFGEVGSYLYLDVFDLPSQTIFYSTELENDAVSTISYNPDGSLLGLVMGDGLIHILDSQTFEEQYTIAGETYPARDFAYNPDGKIIASIYEQTLTLWNMNVLGRLITIDLDLERAPLQEIAFSPDGTLIAVSGGGNIYIWVFPQTNKQRLRAFPSRKRRFDPLLLILH